MSNQIKFRKVQAGYYVGGGHVIYRNQYGWVVKKGAERLTHMTTLKAAQKWVAAR
jgi:hypothetical protein